MYGDLINKWAVHYGLPPQIVAAVVLQESGGCAGAFRYEPAFFDVYIKDKRRQDLAGWTPEPDTGPSLWSEKVGRSTSWGLMQVMGDTSRWCFGLKPSDPLDPHDPRRYFTILCEPSIGIECGCHVLDFYLSKEKNGTPAERMVRALSRYNSGSPISPRGQAYAAKVLSHVASRKYLKVM